MRFSGSSFSEVKRSTNKSGTVMKSFLGHRQKRMFDNSFMQNLLVQRDEIIQGLFFEVGRLQEREKMCLTHIGALEAENTRLKEIDEMRFKYITGLEVENSQMKAALEEVETITENCEKQKSYYEEKYSTDYDSDEDYYNYNQVYNTRLPSAKGE
jgi:arginase family enzyme